MVDRYRVRVYNSSIHGMFLPGGSVNDEAKDITREVQARAIAKSLRFARTGEIARSHRRRVIPSGPLYGTRGQVYNTAPHALIKHRGTTIGRSIHSVRPNGRMRLREWGAWGVIYRHRVSGYHPGSDEPWLLDAANEVLLRYRVRAFDDGDVGPL